MHMTSFTLIVTLKIQKGSLSVPHTINKQLNITADQTRSCSLHITVNVQWSQLKMSRCKSSWENVKLANGRATWWCFWSPPAVIGQWFDRQAPGPIGAQGGQVTPGPLPATGRGVWSGCVCVSDGAGKGGWTEPPPENRPGTDSGYSWRRSCDASGSESPSDSPAGCPWTNHGQENVSQHHQN